MTITRDEQAQLGQLYADFEAAGLMPRWLQREDLMPAAPQPQAVPHRWRWADLLPLAEFGPEVLGTTATPARSRGERLWGHPGLRPISQPDQRNSPLGAYRWEHTDAALTAQLELEAEGSAATIEPGGRWFEVGPGDLFAVPSWAELTLTAEGQVDLFRFSDEPLYEALNLARTSRGDRP